MQIHYESNGIFQLFILRYYEVEHSRRDQKSLSIISTYLRQLTAYINSKFGYVVKYIKTELTKLYTNIMEQKFALEKPNTSELFIIQSYHLQHCTERNGFSNYEEL